jgi:hypothetical protein
MTRKGTSDGSHCGVSHEEGKREERRPGRESVILSFAELAT